MKGYLPRRASLFLIAGFLLTAHPGSLAQQSGHATAADRPASAIKIWADLMAGNQRFVAGKPKARELPALRKQLVAGQQPEAIILSCSDSRVSPELVFDKSLGDLFVVRTAGNIADSVGLGSIEYAIDHIHSPLLVVLGHQKCGAVIAACSGEKMPSRNLEAIVDKIGPAVAKAKTQSKPDDLIETAIKDNVHQSAQDLENNSEIIRDAVKLTIIEAEYQLASGEVVRLNAPAGAHN